MRYQMGTAQLQTWENFERSLGCKQKIAFRLNGIDLSQLEESLKKIVSRHSVLTVSLQKSPEFLNPMVQEADANNRNGQQKVFIGAASATRAGKGRPEYNLEILLINDVDAPLVECLFNPVIVDFHSVLTMIGQAIRLHQNGIVQDETKVAYHKYAPWSNDIINEEEPAAKTLWNELYLKAKHWSDYPFSFEASPQKKPRSYRQVKSSLQLPATTNSALKEKLESDPFSVILAILYAYYSISTDSNPVIGVAYDGRAFEELQTTIGSLTRILPFSLTDTQGLTFLTLLNKVENRSQEMVEWQEYAPVRDKELAGMSYASSLHYVESQKYFHGLTQPVVIESASSQTGKVLSWNFIKRTNPEFDIVLEYDEHLLSEKLVRLIHLQLKQVTEVLLGNPEAELGSLSFLSNEEKTLFTGAFQGEKVEYPTETIPSLFDQAALTNPEKKALYYEDRSLSYYDLKTKVDKLAGQIQAQLKEVESGVVAVEIASGPEQIVALLAVMRAGFTYLPLDPELPTVRKVKLLQKSGALAVIHNKPIGSLLYGLKELIEFAINEEGSTAPRNLAVVKSEGYAYLIFTSGSTGEPKGVRVRHSNVVNTLLWRINAHELNTCTVTLQLPDFSFDSSVEDIFCTLLVGGSLVLAHKEMKKEVVHLNQLIEQYRITNFLIVPSLYRTLLPHLKGDMGSLKTVTVAGEELAKGLAKEHFQRFPNVALINEYGPTECSVCTSFTRLSESENISIGKPIDNMSVYVVDLQNELLPIGQKGQVLVSGPGVFEGYLGDNSAEPSHFITLEIDGEAYRCYNTGDYGRFSHDGKLYFEGREDEQIKLRGYRINLREIEKRILENEKVRECLVTVDLSGNQEGILAYYIPHNQTDELEEILNTSLINDLPAYMVPRVIVKVAEWPLNKNGKIDKQQLAKLFRSSSTKILPTTEQEEVLLNVWKSVLNKEEISTDADFYKIGGDSIKSIQMAARLFEIGYKLEVKEIFKNPVLKDQALIMRSDSVSSSSQEPVFGPVALTPIQKSYFSMPGWLEEHYCQSVLLKLNDHYLDAEIQNCLDELVAHHDMLRATFKTSPIEQIISDNKIKTQVLEYKGDDVVAYIESQAYRFFEKATLQAQELFQFIQINAKGETYLMIISHHLVIDTVSWRILLEDFNNLLQKIRNKQALSLPLKTGSYKDFAEDVWNRSKPNDRAYDQYLKEVEKFRNEGLQSRLNRKNSLIKEVIKIQRSISEETVSAVRKALADTGLKWRDLLLAAVGYGVNVALNQDRMMVFIENHGRSSNLNFNRTIGWFTNVLPIISDTTSDNGIKGLTKSLESTFQMTQDWGLHYYATQKFETYSPENSFVPIDIILNFLGDLDADIDNLASFDIVKQGFEGELSSLRARESVIEVFAWIKNRKLEVEFIFCDTQLDKEIIAELADVFGKQLSSFIFASRDGTEDSKFDYDALSKEDMQTLFE